MLAVQYISGVHAVLAMLQTRPEAVVKLCCQMDKSTPETQTAINLAKKYGIAIEQWTAGKLAQLVDGKRHQGIVAAVRLPVAGSEIDLKDFIAASFEHGCIVLLDELQDPHNFGACIRAAKALGARAIIYPKHRSVQLTPTVYTVSAGTAANMPLFAVTNLAATMRFLQEQNVWLYGASVHTEQRLNEINVDCRRDKIAIVMGAEHAGLRAQTAKLCDHLFRIPIMPDVESLNVSVALGIALYAMLLSRN